MYLQWSEGFRLGNTSYPIPKVICDVNDDGILDGTNAPIEENFDSDNTESFEFGAKFSLLDDRLQINAAIYRVDWEGIPLTVFAEKLPEQASQICFSTAIINAGEAQSQGLEVETSYQITQALRVNFGGAYTDPELAEDTPILGAVSGDRLPSSPAYNISLGFEYEFDFSGRPSYIRSDYTYVDEFYNRIGGKR